MAELIPIPLPLLLRRAFLEYERQGTIFDLPKAKFYRGFPDVDLSVDFHGHRAATPLGPAAGPHGQLVQNIVLSWLGGSRIIELKTVQILDELKIPRPCIDIANVGYNVEWSQELKLERSLREYVGVAMFLEILKASNLLGDGIPTDTVFDMSVGYNLEGIRSPRVRSWMETMMDATPVIDELRASLAGEWQRYRELPFPTRISDTISLSTFHGCPAREIEGIVTFLLEEMGCHVCIKLNPTLLGKQEVAHLLHDVLGYREIAFHPPAFDNDLQFDEALDLIPRLQRVAARQRRSLGVKFTNTLVVRNHKSFFGDEQMYMSGAPLHVLAINLIKKFRAHMPGPIPISFSAGLDANNMARAVAMNFVPATTCTDLLRPGGYARLIRYLEKLAEEMRKVGAANIRDFILNFRGQAEAAGGDVNRAGLLNTRILVAEATADPRYTWERNKGVPRKIGSKLWLYDCINCDKCVPVCPNDANFVYETQPATVEYDNFELLDGELRRVPGGVLRVMKAHQLANYADACNECGNCDVFCPEDGGPYIEKPRFFGSLETYRQNVGSNGFFIDWDGGRTIHGTIAGRQYVLALDEQADFARWEQPDAEVEIRLSDDRPLSWKPKPGSDGPARTLNMLPYLQLKLLLGSIADPRHVNFANVGALQEQS
ncbi:MAG TPA: 4Fe-4S dicluster domain-containing protein [Bryobacteraceae bacterium]|nr:4Fe-4S dicluster domain-containing protein [Bryobacteraceae bacterium]